MAVSIGTVKPRISWRLKTVDLFDVRFQRTRPTRTLVTFSPLEGLSVQDIKAELLVRGEDQRIVPISKIKGVSGKSRSLSFDLDSNDWSFEIDHDVDLESGIEFKIGLNSTTIETTTTIDGLYSASKQYSYFAQTRHWVFYHNGTNPVYKSALTLSGLTAALETDVFSSATPPTEADWSVAFNAGNVIACFSEDFNEKGYRNGIFTAGGTITWNSTDLNWGSGNIRGQTNIVFRNNGVDGFMIVGHSAGGVDLFSSREAITLNTPVISALSSSPVFSSVGSNNDSTRDSLVPFDISPISAAGDCYTVIWSGTSGGKTQADRLRIAGCAWDDSLSAWVATVDIISDTINAGADSELQDGVLGKLEMSARQDLSGDIHVVYLTLANAIKHKKITPSITGSTISTLSSDVTGLASHTRIGLAANGSDLMLIYDKGDQNLYRRTFDGTVWGAETADVKTNANTIQGAISCSDAVNGEILVMWVEDQAGVNKVMIQSIAVAAGNPNAKVVADSASASDASSIAVFIGLIDSAASAEAPGIVSALGLFDAASSAESPAVSALTPINLLDAGSGTETPGIVIDLTLPDTGSGLEVIQLAVSTLIPDSGSGGDLPVVAVLNPVNLSDAGSGLEIPGITLAITLPDTGSGTETTQVAVAFSILDLGSGADTPALVIDLVLPDAGSGVETIQIGVTAAILETGSGADVPVVIAVNPVALSDAGSGIENESLVIDLVLPDSGGGIEAFQLLISALIPELGVGAEGLTVVTPNAAHISEIGSGAETTGLVIDLNLPDTGSGLESVQLAADVSILEAGSGQDTALLQVTLPLTEIANGLDTLQILTALGLSESATGAEALTVEAPGIINLSEVLVGSETISLQAAVTLPETGAGIESLLVNTGVIIRIIQMAAVQLAVPRMANVQLAVPQMSDVQLIA